MAKNLWPSAVAEFDKHWDERVWSDQTTSRRTILEVFLRLAVEHGFNSVSMRMIAKEMNIKPPSLYAHFADGRDEIVAESLRWHFFKFGRAVLQEIRDIGDPEEGWRRLIEIHLTRQVQLPENDLWDLLIATDQIVHFLPSSLRAEVDAWIDLYEDLYRAAATDMGYRRPDDRVKLVMTLLEGANRWVSLDGKPKSLAAGVAKATTASFLMLNLSEH